MEKINCIFCSFSSMGGLVMDCRDDLVQQGEQRYIHYNKAMTFLASMLSCNNKKIRMRY
jgi:hypothetical protein